VIVAAPNDAYVSQESVRELVCCAAPRLNCSSRRAKAGQYIYGAVTRTGIVRACKYSASSMCRIVQARHWPGSELRWVPGGHVTAFVLQRPAFRRAITDSLERAAAPPRLDARGPADATPGTSALGAA